MKQIAENGDNPGSPQRFVCRDKSRNDTLNRAGAMALAQKLEHYWHSRGYWGARFWAEPIAERFDKIGTHEIYRIVCNLKRGIPPRFVEPINERPV